MVNENATASTPPPAITPPAGPHSLASRIGSVSGFLRSTLAFLADSEWCLVELMQATGIWTPPPPTGTPPADYAVRGQLEWGDLLFLLHNPGLIEDATIRRLVEVLTSILHFAEVALPPTNLTEARYASLAEHRIAAPGDGSIAGTGAYELYDQRWVGAFFNIVKSIVEGRIFADGELPIPAAGTAPFTATPRANGRVRLALLGDWGTGDAAARAVMASAAALDPDLVVHLGDVYYSGTPEGGPFTPAGEETGNLLALWPDQFAGCSFALNSNHEMYSGAIGYFREALDGAGTPFAQQGGYSVFAIRIGDWMVLGLDTAYYAEPLQLYLYGSLGLQTDSRQADWIRSLGLDRSKLIVLTHHNGVDIACDPIQQIHYAPLWTQLRSALGGDPFAWYWGHVHNGVVYAAPLTITDATGAEALSTTTCCRCLGHAALPYGPAAALAGHPQIVWRASTPTGDGQGLLNGFATLDFQLDGEGQVVSIAEHFHDTGSDQPRYSATIFAAAPPIA